MSDEERIRLLEIAWEFVKYFPPASIPTTNGIEGDKEILIKQQNALEAFENAYNTMYETIAR